MIWQMQVRVFRYSSLHGWLSFMPPRDAPKWLKRLRRRERSSAPVTIYNVTATATPTRAEMVARMLELRNQAIAKGMRLLTLDEINNSRND